MDTTTLPALADPGAPPLPLQLTAAAAAKVAELVAEEGNPELKLRLYVTGGGCSGFSYGFAFDDKVSEDDTKIDRDGVSMLVDAMSLQYLIGAEIDFEDGLEGSRFVIHNPNAQTTCGCGSSFSM
jgi:iron-sulfur cluster assembly accessory protein